MILQLQLLTRKISVIHNVNLILRQCRNQYNLVWVHNDCFQLGVWSTINTHFSFDAHSHQRTIYLVLALMHWCCNFYNYAAGVYEIICMIKTSFCEVHNNWWNFWKSGTQLLCTLFLKKYGKHNSVVLRIQNFYDLLPFSVCFFSY